MKKDYYIYVEYEKCYPVLFERIKKKLLKSLGKFSKIAKIEHIGSSSVPGLGGKGLIDVLIAVPKDKMREAMRLLVKSGYLRDEKHDLGIRYFFRKNYVGFGRKREMHISITFGKGWMWQNAIATRDYLRNHQKDLKMYAKIKKEGTEIAKGEEYRKHKLDFL
jgi:GrpB-like predicted nucleotidyltransferase (UPF0157 family)